MSWAAELLAIQDALVTALALAVPGAKVTTEPVEAQVSGTLVALHLVSLEIEAQNSMVDEAKAEFRISARWDKVAGQSGSASWMVQAEALRAALLGAAPPSYGGLVTEIRWSDLGPKTSAATRGDRKWDMLMIYVCRLILNRREGA